MRPAIYKIIRGDPHRNIPPGLLKDGTVFRFLHHDVLLTCGRCIHGYILASTMGDAGVDLTREVN